MRHRDQVAGRTDDRDVPVVIGAQQRHAKPGHFGQQQRRRVAIVVVEADADDGDLRVNRGKEVRIEVGRPVVRHLQHVGPQVGSGREEVLLSLDLRVAGEQDPDPTHLRPQHEG